MILFIRDFKSPTKFLEQMRARREFIILSSQTEKVCSLRTIRALARAFVGFFNRRKMLREHGWFSTRALLRLDILISNVKMAGKV